MHALLNDGSLMNITDLPPHMYTSTHNSIFTSGARVFTRSKHTSSSPSMARATSQPHPIHLICEGLALVGVPGSSPYHYNITHAPRHTSPRVFSDITCPASAALPLILPGSRVIIDLVFDPRSEFPIVPRVRIDDVTLTTWLRSFMESTIGLVITTHITGLSYFTAIGRRIPEITHPPGEAWAPNCQEAQQ
ncbi:hypothetical protein BD779DRAFT_722083 [Infundibulicybe gibba]|nr:hypothetical protein BD779DRAFT_722083 [Infundibulicybe gibba]